MSTFSDYEWVKAVVDRRFKMRVSYRPTEIARECTAPMPIDVGLFNEQEIRELICEELSIPLSDSHKIDLTYE